MDAQHKNLNILVPWLQLLKNYKYTMIYDIVVHFMFTNKLNQ